MTGWQWQMSTEGVPGWWVRGMHRSWMWGPEPDGLYHRVTWGR